MTREPAAAERVHGCGPKTASSAHLWFQTFWQHWPVEQCMMCCIVQLPYIQQAPLPTMEISDNVIDKNVKDDALGLELYRFPAL